MTLEMGGPRYFAAVIDRFWRSVVDDASAIVAIFAFWRRDIDPTGRKEERSSWERLLKALDKIVLLGVAPTIPNISSVSIRANNAATFSASPSGTAPFTYQWQVSYDNVVWTPADTFIWTTNSSDIVTADTSSMTIPNPPIRLTGTYIRCRVSNAYGFALSNSATLTVSPPSSATQLYIISDPGGFFQSGIYEGMGPPFHTALLPNTAPSLITLGFGFGGGTGQGVTVAWQTSANGVTSWGPLSGFQTSADGTTITLTSPQTSYNGSYYHAIITDISNPSNTVTTNPARLDCIDPIVAASTTGGDGTTDGGVWKKVGTGSVVFMVNAQFLFSNPTYTWQISTDYGVTWSTSGSNTATQTVAVTNISQNQNEYRCVVADSVGSVNSDPMVLTVTP